MSVIGLDIPSYFSPLLVYCEDKYITSDVSDF